MSYDKPNRQKYQVTVDFGGQNGDAFHFLGPKGKAGRLVDYGVEGVTEVVDAAATLAIGTASDPDHYGDEFSLITAVDTPKTVRSSYDPIADKTAFDLLMLIPELPKDTNVVMTLTQATTTGIGTIFMIIDWAD